jgi:hypothetical protein
MRTILKQLGELKAAITAKIREIPKEECVRVIDNFARCMQVCLQRQGCHLEHIYRLLEFSSINYVRHFLRKYKLPSSNQSILLYLYS